MPHHKALLVTCDLQAMFDRHKHLKALPHVPLVKHCSLVLKPVPS